MTKRNTKIVYCLLFIVYCILFTALPMHTVNAQGTWTQKASHPGGGRYAIVGFSIAAKGYIGTGLDAIGPTKAFWEWDQATDVWTQKADFGGSARYYAAAFTIGSKAYIGTGFDGTNTQQDFWEWDQATNIWTQRADFAGGPRMRARGFSIGNKGYFIAGTNPNDYNAMVMDLWEYDPNLNPPLGTWTQKASFPGTPRIYPTVFSICGKGYLATGYTVSSGSSFNDFWEYDPVTDTWTQRTNFPGTPSNQTVGFGIGNKGYMGVGRSGYQGTYLTQFFEYDPSTDTWATMANFAGPPRAYSMGFSICNKGFVGTGYDGVPLADFWEFASPTNNPTVTQINSTCYESIDGTATVYPICGTPPYTYSWNTSPVQTTSTATGLGVGSYTVNIIDSIGCTSTATVNVISNPVNPSPVSNFIFSTVCLGQNTVFTDQSIVASGTISAWNWNFGNGNTSTLQNPVHTYTASGVYTVALTVTTNSGCVDTITNVVTVYPQPTSNFSSTTVCPGNATQFTNSSIGGGTSWSWDFGNGNTSTLQDPSNTYSSAGNYTATLVATDSIGGCSSFISQTVTVYSPPVVNFSASIVCVNTPSTVFTDLSIGANSWNWNFGDGSPNSTAQNPSHIYSTAGTYSVTLIASTINGCPDTLVQNIIVNPKPAANFTAPAVCFNNPTNFTDQSTGILVQWNWNFGDGGNSTLQNPLYSYDTPGNFMATLIVTNSFGCTDTIQQNVLVNPLPIANFSSTTVCVTNQTCLSDLSTISSGTINGWSWDFGDPISGSNTSAVQSPCHIFSSANTFNVTLTVASDSGCQSTIVLPVLVNPFPVAGFTATIVCMNVSTPFNNTSSGATQWNWDFGDGNNSSLQNPSHTYTGFGNFIVTQIATSGGNCIDTIVGSVTVYPIPMVNFIANSVCVGDTTTFTDLSSIPTGTLTNWNWNFGDGTTSTLQNPTHAYTSSGIYNVTLIVTSNNNCQTTLTSSATVYSKPIANFSYTPGKEMLMDAVLFNDLSISNITSWAWDLGDGTFSTLMNPIHLYTDTGTYFITLIVVDNNGCQDTVNYPIVIQEFDFYIPNSFTPNGDENNEFFFGRGIGIIEYEMWIFNRWGDLIFSCHVNDLPQSLPCRWNGILPGGTTIYKQDVYVWKVQLKSVFKKEYNYMGHVNILR